MYSTLGAGIARPLRRSDRPRSERFLLYQLRSRGFWMFRWRVRVASLLPFSPYQQGRPSPRRPRKNSLRLRTVPVLSRLRLRPQVAKRMLGEPSTQPVLSRLRLFTTPATSGARLVDVRVPSALAMQASTFRLDLCQPTAPALPVGERGFRHVPVSWAALKQAAACQ
jgi:hypothetical protein